MPETLASQTLQANSMRLHLTARMKLLDAAAEAVAGDPAAAAAKAALDVHGGLQDVLDAFMSGEDTSALVATLSADEDFTGPLDVLTQSIHSYLS